MGFGLGTGLETGDLDCGLLTGMGVFGLAIGEWVLGLWTGTGGVWLGVWDWDKGWLGLLIMIDDWELGIVIGDWAGDWDCGLGTGDWDWDCEWGFGIGFLGMGIWD